MGVWAPLMRHSFLECMAWLEQALATSDAFSSEWFSTLSLSLFLACVLSSLFTAGGCVLIIRKVNYHGKYYSDASLAVTRMNSMQGLKVGAVKPMAFASIAEPGLMIVSYARDCH